jgi:plastocyanin
MSSDRLRGLPTRTLLALAAMVSITGVSVGPVSAQGQTHRIDMKGVAFAPAEITVRVGDTLEWNNADIAAHTATSKESGFDVNVLPGRKGTTVVKQAGTFSYTCRYHPTMKGQIVVEP